MFEVDEAEYHCSPEWHLAKMTPCTRVLYPFALRMSKTSERFFCSARKLAIYFGYEERQIRRAILELEHNGFFELIEARPFNSNVYRVLSHNAWKKKNPEECVTKAKFPWDGEGDKLAQRLYAVSGGRKFFQNQIVGLRNLGWDEEFIVSEFQKFFGWWKPQGSRYDKRHWFRRFYFVMKIRADLKRDGQVDGLEHLLLKIYDTSGHLFVGNACSHLSNLLRSFTGDEILAAWRGFLETSDSKHAAMNFCEVAEVLILAKRRR